MKVSILVCALLAVAGVSTGTNAKAADPLVTCSYKPTPRTSENLPLNANTVYVDVESPKDSFLLLGKESDGLLQQAQQMITQRKIQTGVVYSFTRGVATDARISVVISPILTGQMTNNVPQIVDFSIATPPTKVGAPTFAAVADGVSCSLKLE